jgi:hypothetical protein
MIPIMALWSENIIHPIDYAEIFFRLFFTFVLAFFFGLKGRDRINRLALALLYMCLWALAITATMMNVDNPMSLPSTVHF